MPGRRWMQANVRLRPRRGSYDLHGFFSELFPLARALERARKIDGFFFVRKPPGVRLRFALVDGAAEGAIVEHLNAAPRVEWFPSCYEPETFQLGGPEATEVVHRHAGVDARAWWDLERAATKNLGASVLSLAVLNDLFRAVVEDDGDEVWDVWCHVAAAHGARPVDDGNVPRIAIEHIAPRASAAEQRVLRAYARANRAFARSFGRLHANGKLLYARRLVLPYVALFHWNRFGFSLEERQRMYGAMTAAWSPKRRNGGVA